MFSAETLHRRPPRALAAIAAGALAAVSLLLGAGPASAHDELVASDPSADATVETLPAQLTLTFSGELAVDDRASEVEVTDAAGTSLVAGPPVVSGTVLTQPLQGEASGAIRVLWRVVSSDTHPISGEYFFTVQSASPPTPTPTSTETETATPTEAPPTATPTSSPEDEDEDSSFADVWPWVVGGILVAAIGGAVVYLLASRARGDRALAEGRKSGSASPPPGGSEPPADR